MVVRPDEIKVKAVIELEFDEEALSEAIKEALVPEARLELRGVKSELFAYGRKTKLVIEAKDPSSFRAALNALLRLASTLLKAIREIKSLKRI